MERARISWLVGAGLTPGAGGGCYEPIEARIDFGAVSASSGGAGEGGAGGGAETVTPEAYFEDPPTVCGTARISATGGARGRCRPPS